MHALLSSSRLKTDAKKPAFDQAQSFEALAAGPLGLLTFTSELTAFDGAKLSRAETRNLRWSGGVKELERKAMEHGLRTAYLPAPPNNPDPDTNLMVLTLM
eukprot:2164181-Rhodomonas_salina.1